MTESTQARPRARDSGAAIAVAMGVMNVATYVFQMVTARVLGPQDFGAFAALMNVLLVVGVMSLAVQATAARRISAEPGDVVGIEQAVLRVTYRSAAVLGLLLILAAPLINLLLRLESLASAALVGVIAVPLTVMGGQAGVLQGERRWGPLAVLYIAAGVPRLLLGTGLVIWQPSEATAVLAVAIGAVFPVIVGAVALRRPRDGQHHDGPATPSILGEVAHSSQALLAFFALSNADVIVARNVLEGREAGLYAAGLIMTKAVLFLPQFVVVVAFPAMSTVRERRRTLIRGLLLVAAIGVAATLGAFVLSGLAMVFVGGGQYADIESQLWLFAVLGMLLSMLQLLVYSVLARQGRRSVYAPWAALVALVLAGTMADTVEALLAVVVTVDLLLLVVLLLISLVLTRHPVPDDDRSGPSRARRAGIGLFIPPWGSLPAPLGVSGRDSTVRTPHAASRHARGEQRAAGRGGRRLVVLNWRDCWHPEGGGSELYVREVSRRLAAAGREVTIFTARYPGAPSTEVREGIRYVRRGGHLTVYLWAAALLLLGRLGPLGRADDVLEVQNGMPFLARLTTRARVVVLVHHVHREQWSILSPALARFGWWMESRVAVRVNRGCRYVAVSEVTRSELVDLGVRAADVTIAWNGTPPVPEHEPRPESPAPQLVMLVRLVPHKRVEHAMDAVAALRERHPGLHLTVMGSGWWEPQLLEHRAALGLDDAVELLGHVSDRTKFEVLSGAWVHLLPSVKEGWGLSIVEAAHVGVPSVAYADAGGVRESILDGVTGLLARDQPDLVARVDELLSDPALRREMGAKAQVRSAQFTWDSTASAFERVLG